MGRSDRSGRPLQRRQSAIYAAMNADAKVQNRIRHIYSLDGPGFPSEIVTSPAYRRIQPKVTKIVPSSSIVGMIFETPEPCRVVSSDSDGIMQHSAFTWLVDGDQFVTEPDLSSSSQLFNEELNHWLARLRRNSASVQWTPCSPCCTPMAPRRSAK